MRCALQLQYVVRDTRDISRIQLCRALTIFRHHSRSADDRALSSREAIYLYRAHAERKEGRRRTRREINGDDIFCRAGPNARTMRIMAPRGVRIGGGGICCERESRENNSDARRANGGGTYRKNLREFDERARRRAFVSPRECYPPLRSPPPHTGRCI